MKIKGCFLLVLQFILTKSLAVADWSWVQKAEFPGIPRHRACAFAIGERGYIGLGHINSGSLSVAYEDWWEYDPATNSWTQKANYPAGPRFGNYCFGFDNCAYVGGGAIQSWGAANEFFKFDPVSNTWTYMGISPITGEGKPSFVIGDSGYVGGMGFNRLTNTWFAAPQANVGYWDYVFVINDKAYFDQGGTMIEYDPRTNSVIGRGTCPNTYMFPTAFAVNNKGYVIMGTNYATEFRDQFVYDPMTNSWDTLKSFPGSGRHYGPTFTIANKAYMGTGSNGTNLSDFWEFGWHGNSNSSVSVETEKEIVQIETFPSPFTNNFTILNKQESRVSLKLLDLNGRLIWSEKMESKTNAIIDTKDIAIGSYILIGEDLTTHLQFQKTIIKQ